VSKKHKDTKQKAFEEDTPNEDQKAEMPSQQDQQSPAMENLPLFFKKPVPLDKQRHEKAGIKPNVDFAFASEATAVPLNMVEFAEIAKHYPIVFSKEEACLPMGVLGMKDQNLFVKDGQWEAHCYIPAYVRKYPFALVQIPDSEQMALCVDEEAPHYSGDAMEEGVRSFHTDGEPSDMTKQALDFCSHFQQHFRITEEACKAFKEANIFMDEAAKVQLPGGHVIELGDLRIVDENKVRNLPKDTIQSWHERGWLPAVYYAISSYSNWMYLAQRNGESQAGGSMVQESMPEFLS